MLSKAIFRHATLVALLLPALAHASLINGTLAIGSLNVVIISASGGLGNIQFTPNGNGDNFILNASTGTFAPYSPPALVTGNNGRITSSLNQSTEPVNSTFSLPTWLTIDGTSPALSFTLMEVLGGSFSNTACTLAPAPGQTCTPSLTPYNLDNLGTVQSGVTGSSASFTVYGQFVDGTPADSAYYYGTFSTTFTGQSYQDLLTTVANGGSINTSWNANFTPAAGTPEMGPLTLTLSGLGLMALSMLRRKRLS